MSPRVRETERERRFRAVCAPLEPELMRFALWLSRDRQIAQDVVQEALLRAWRSFEALKDVALAKHWLLTIVRREHARLYERKRHETVDIDELVASEAVALATSTQADDGIDDVRRAIFALEEDYREPLVLQVLMGYTTEEIAEHMSLNQGAVLTRLFRARNKLRERLGIGPDESQDSHGASA
jgi:RNA polymerase sigma-70 factor (ECF subfamily)